MIFWAVENFKTISFPCNMHEFTLTLGCGTIGGNLFLYFFPFPANNTVSLYISNTRDVFSCKQWRWGWTWSPWPTTSTKGGGGGNKYSDFIGGHNLPAAIRLGIRRALTRKDLLCITISMCNYAIYYAIIKNKRSKKSLAPSREPLVR